MAMDLRSFISSSTSCPVHCKLFRIHINKEHCDGFGAYTLSVNRLENGVNIDQVVVLIAMD